MEHLIQVVDLLEPRCGEYKCHMMVTNTTQTDLVAAANLSLSIDLNHSGKLHIPPLVEVVGDAKAVTVTGKVVPLVHINAISLVGYNLQHNEIWSNQRMCNQSF